MSRRKTHRDTWWAEHPEVVRCSATLVTTGDRCRTEAHPGAPVCYKHGANLPAVRDKAARRIGVSLDDAVKRLQAMLDDPSTEARDKIKILHDLLDRGGLGATNKVLVGVTEVDPVEQLFRDLMSTPGILTDAVTPEDDAQFLALNRAADRDPDTDPGPYDVVDAELVEDTPAPAPEPERVSARPPARIRRDLERFGLL